MIDPGYVDNDQLKLFIWLREAASDRRTLIRRHMKRDDPADPAAWPGLRERIADADRRCASGRDREKRRKQLFNQARYHLRRIHGRAGGRPATTGARSSRPSSRLVDDGLPPSNVDLRDLVLPIADRVPRRHGVARNRRAGAARDRPLRGEPAGRAKPNGERHEAPTEEVRRARDLLRGPVAGADRRRTAAAGRRGDRGGARAAAN